MFKIPLSLLAWTVTILTGIVVFPPMILAFMMARGRGKTFVGKFFLRIMVWSFLQRVRCEGRDAVDVTKPHVFMANHSSFIDLFLLGTYLPGPIRGIEAAEHFSWPVWGTVLKHADFIPIDRKNPRASIKSLDRAVERIREGYSILILPEGTRSTDGNLIEFKKLPFKLPKKGGTDIIPVGIEGAFEAKRKTSWILRPGRIVMRFGDPISEETVREKNAGELAELCKRRVAELARKPFVADR